MKLNSLNGIIMLYCLVLAICSETSTMSESERKKRLNMYEANDQLLDKSDKSAISESRLNHQTFLEKKTEKKQRQYSDLVIIHGKNRNLNISSEHINTKKCESKQGFLEIIDRDADKQVVTSKVRAVIDKESIKMYTTMDENSIFLTIHLDNIMKISQDKKYFHTNCFDLVTNIADSIEKVLHKSRVTLCTDNSLEMDDWMHFILELKECGLNSNNGKKVVLDFNEINKLKNKKEDDFNLWYDNSKQSTSKQSAQSTRDRIIHQTVKNLMHNLQTNQLEGNKLKRTLNDQLREARKFTSELEKKKDVVQELIQEKVEKQMQRNLQLVKTKAQDKEVKLIKAMVEKINGIKVNLF
jgi:hypothetical protein